VLSVVETELIHPPLGLNVFVLKGMVPEVPLWRIDKGVFPFVAADLVKLVILVLFSWITFVGDGHALEKPCKQVAVTGGCCGGGIGADRETQDTHDGGGNDDDQRFEPAA
jgi:hypothetical protein